MIDLLYPLLKTNMAMEINIIFNRRVYIHLEMVGFSIVMLVYQGGQIVLKGVIWRRYLAAKSWSRFPRSPLLWWQWVHWSGRTLVPKTSFGSLQIRSQGPCMTVRAWPCDRNGQRKVPLKWWGKDKLCPTQKIVRNNPMSLTTKLSKTH